MKKFLAVILSGILMVSIIAISGCGKKETKETTPAAQTAQTEQQQQPAAQPAAPATQDTTQTQTTEKAAADKATQDKAKQDAQKPAAQEAPKPVEKTPFENYLDTLPGKLNPDAVQGKTIVYQFNITDGHPGLYWVKIQDGKCTVGKGTVAKFDTKINVGEQLWLDMRSDKVNGTMAYLQKKFTVEGNTDNLSNMKKYFTK